MLSADAFSQGRLSLIAEGNLLLYPIKADIESIHAESIQTDAVFVKPVSVNLRGRGENGASDKNSPGTEGKRIACFFHRQRKNAPFGALRFDLLLNFDSAGFLLCGNRFREGEGENAVGIAGGHAFLRNVFGAEAALGHAASSFAQDIAVFAVPVLFCLVPFGADGEDAFVHVHGDAVALNAGQLRFKASKNEGMKYF